MKDESIVVDGLEYESIPSCPGRFTQENADLDRAISMALSNISELSRASEMTKENDDFSFTWKDPVTESYFDGTAKVQDGLLSLVRLRPRSSEMPTFEYYFDWEEVAPPVRPPSQADVLPKGTDPEDAYTKCAEGLDG